MSDPIPGKPGGIFSGAEFVIDPARLQEVLASRDGPVAKTLLTILAKAENAAKRRCPVDTGRLRSSISTALEQEPTGLVGVIGTNVEYAAPVEFGYETQGGTQVPPAAFLRGGLNEALASVGGGAVNATVPIP